MELTSSFRRRVTLGVVAVVSLAAGTIQAEPQPPGFNFAKIAEEDFFNHFFG